MQSIKTHPEGPVLSRIIVGAWRWHTVSQHQTEILIRTSLESGITTFDHADIYGNYCCEEIFGNVLRANPSMRNNIQLITKCGIKLLSDRRPDHKIKHYDTSKDHIISSAERSLINLATDRIDVLLIHRPDPLLDPAEVAEAFMNLQQQGKVLYFGVSNFTAAQFEVIQSYLPFPLVTNQIELSLFKNQSLFDGTVDTLMKNHTSPMAWSPLGGGKLFEDVRVKTIVQSMNRNYAATETQLLLAWLLKHPSRIFPVIGTTKPERIAESAKSIRVNLGRQHWFEMLKEVEEKDVA